MAYREGWGEGQPLGCSECGGETFHPVYRLREASANRGESIAGGQAVGWGCIGCGHVGGHLSGDYVPVKGAPALPDLTPSA